MFTGGLSFPAMTIELIVKSLVILAVALIFTWFMRRSSAATRHLVLSAAAVSLVVLPFVSPVLPSWNIGTVPDPFVPAYDDLADGPAQTPAPLSMIPDERIEPGASGAGVSPVGAKPWIRWLNWLLVAWGVGALILLLRLIGGKTYGWRITAAAPKVEDERLLGAVRRVAGRLGITHPIPVVESDHLKVPFVWGLFRPRLILPPRARKWPSERIEAVLHHELAHVKRRDTLSQFLAQIACCIYWVNPLAWILERRLFIERERACDDVAISRDTKASDYAGYLMEVLEELGTTRNQAWVVSAMAEGTDFKDRVLSVLDPAAERTAPGPSRRAVVLGLSAVLLLPLASIHPLGRAAPPPSEPESPATEASAPDRVVDDARTGALIEALSSSDAKAREHAASDLGETADPSAVPDLIEALEDDSPRVREHVATALGQIGDRTAVPPLNRIAESDADARVREHAAAALGQIGEGAAVPPLSRIVESDTDARVRVHAATALGQIKERAAIPPLSRVVESDADGRVREHAATALGMIGKDDDAYHVLVEAYETDASVRVRAHAAFALGLMRDERAIDLLFAGLHSQHPEIRSHCAEALGMIGGDRVVSQLNEVLSDPNPDVRRSAERALRMLRGR